MDYGHEVGHVLGLKHVSSLDRLMIGGGTNRITRPPPDLTICEGQKMGASPFSPE